MDIFSPIGKSDPRKTQRELYPLFIDDALALACPSLDCDPLNMPRMSRYPCIRVHSPFSGAMGPWIPFRFVHPAGL